MKILVAVASRHGSTEEIARAIANELRSAGNAVDLLAVGSVDTIDGYDRVVLGSAVYVGNWLAEARQFVLDHREELVCVPVWLFSSGPIGADDPKPHGDPAIVADLVKLTGARGYANFAGKLDPSALGLGERIITKVVGAPTGDFRNWESIREWAHEIATMPNG